MSQQYSDPTREEDPHALPDVEVFYRGQPMCDHCGQDMIGRETCRDCGAILPEFEAGWYYWFCFPGCLPDSEPMGPFATEQDAIDAAQEEE